MPPLLLPSTKPRIAPWLCGVLGAIACTTAIAAASMKADSAADPSLTPTLAIVGATLIDGTGRPPISDSVILIAGDNIIAAGPRRSIQVPSGTTIYRATNRWIMPGMIDAHVHFHETGRIYTNPGALDLTSIVSYDDEIKWMKQRLPVTLERYLCAGVTTAISVGGPHFEYEVRELATHLDKAPNVFVGHGPIIAVPLGPEVFPKIDGDVATRTVANANEARAEIQRGVSWGADLIKAGYLGAAFTARLEAGHPEKAAANAESHYFDILPVMVAEAHTHGLPITIHVTDMDASKKSLAAGVDSLAHTANDREVDDEFLQLALAHHATVMTTLALWTRQVQGRTGHVLLTPVESRCGDPEVISSWTAIKTLPAVPDSMIEAGATRQRIAMANVKKMHDAGIPLAVGVDAGNFGLLHGASVHQEIDLMRQAGIPPMDIILAATRNAAGIAGKANAVGTIEPGKLADLLILTRDPLLDIRNVGAIDQVMKSGRLYREADLLP
jgi:imidazolonepropionase-like amidohydrolase